MKQPLTLAAATLLVVACSDNPVAPPREAPAATKASMSTSAASTQLDFTDLTNDMVGRLLPSFDDQTTAKSIESAMLELNAHAIAGEITDAQASSQTIRAALKDGVANAQLLDAMNRTMDVVDRGLSDAAGTTTDVVLGN